MLSWLSMVMMSDNDSNDSARLAPVIVSRATVEKLLYHAAFAAHLIGHLDDNAHRELTRQLGDHVDTIAHELAEFLGALGALAESDAAAHDDREARHGAPMSHVHRGRCPVNH